MKYRSILLTLFAVMAFSAAAQNYDKSNYFVYHVFTYNDNRDTNKSEVYRIGQSLYLMDAKPEGQTIPGYSTDLTIADYAEDSITYQVNFDKESYYAKVPLSRTGITWDTLKLKGNKVKYTCSINSNKLEFVVYTGNKYTVTLMPGYGRLDGVLLEYWRNGLKIFELGSHGKKTCPYAIEKNKDMKRVDAHDLNNIKTNHLIQTTRVFDDVQLSWGKENAKVVGEMPFDSVMHFAGGTLALKRVKLPVLPAQYQTFIELHQYSNGDAYDRTGCVFVIPHRMQHTFLEGIAQHPDSLPILKDRTGSSYQGVVRTDNYEPIVELMRFFTPFGIRKFNDRVKVDGVEWRDETYYKQEVTELSDLLSGDVWIGVWIGNYDGGGHKVTLDIKSYPNDYVMGDIQPRYKDVIPLFTTTNVLEMAGQNYGRIFGKDSLRVSFDIPEGAKNVRLRYITTGHGGWDGGDEFNPKPNTIIIDGSEKFVYTPWRCDCGRYREWNPVSGTSWDGLTSSDYSRSGWCPGTATQPTYFDLGAMTPGRHTITVAIPQGEPMEGGFSAWNVSGVLFVE